MDNNLSVTMPIVRIGSDHYAASFSYNGNFILTSVQQTQSPAPGLDDIDLATGEFSLITQQLELFCVLYNGLEYNIILKLINSEPGVTAFQLLSIVENPGCSSLRAEAPVLPFVEPLDWDLARVQIAMSGDIFASVEPLQAAFDPVQSDFATARAIFGNPSFQGNRSLECAEFTEFWDNNSSQIQQSLDQANLVMNQYLTFAHMASFINASKLLTAMILEHDMEGELSADALQQFLLDRENTLQELDYEAPRILDFFATEPQMPDFGQYATTMQGTWLTVVDQIHGEFASILNPYGKSQYDLLAALDITAEDVVLPKANFENKMQDTWGFFHDMVGTELCMHRQESEMDDILDDLASAVDQARNVFQALAGQAQETVRSLDDQTQE